MFTNKQEELRSVQKKMILLQIVGTIGAALLGLGLYGKFGADGDAFISILNDPEYVYSFIAIGAIIMVWEFITIVPLFKKRAELVNNESR